MHCTIMGASMQDQLEDDEAAEKKVVDEWVASML